jgi:hypothetical protein
MNTRKRLAPAEIPAVVESRTARRKYGDTMQMIAPFLGRIDIMRIAVAALITAFVHGARPAPIRHSGEDNRTV